MPIFNNATGIYKIGYDTGLGTGVICQDFTHDYDLSISNIQELMCGGGGSIVKKIDNVISSTVVTGPMLFAESSYLGERLAAFVDYLGLNSLDDIGFYDTYWYAVRLMGKHWLNIGGSSLLSGIMVESVNISIDDNGLTTKIQYFTDPVDAGDTSIGRIIKATTPDPGITALRESRWYDFYTKMSYSPTPSVTDVISFPIKNCVIDIGFEYETVNPIGGLAKFLSKDTSSLTNQYWMHTPFRTLKNVMINCTITGLMRNDITNDWGKSKILGITSSDLRKDYFHVSTQKEDVGYFEPYDFDIFTINGSSIYPLIKTILFGSTSVNSILYPYYSGSKVFVENVAWYIMEVIENNTAGFLDVDIKLEGIAPIRMVQ